MKFFKRRLVFGSVMAACAALLVAGCGGGGGGPSTPATVPTSPGAVNNCTAATYTPNFVSSVTLLHWTAFPLHIYFTPDANYSATRQTQAQAGFDRWVAATQNAGNYVLVNTPAQANVIVHFYIFTGGPGDTLGTTTVNYTPSNNVIQSADMALGVTGNANEDTTTAAHEYGHLLGISGHSPNPLDLMYPTANLSGQVTQSDLDTILTAYCGVFPQASPLVRRTNEPTRTLVMH